MHLANRFVPDDELSQTAVAMRERAVKVLSEEEKISNPYPNVDAVSGTLLNASGLTDSDYYTVLFDFPALQAFPPKSLMSETICEMVRA